MPAQFIEISAGYLAAAAGPGWSLTCWEPDNPHASLWGAGGGFATFQWGSLRVRVHLDTIDFVTTNGGTPFPANAPATSQERLAQRDPTAAETLEVLRAYDAAQHTPTDSAPSQ